MRFDFVVAGAGSAGSTLASRLSEDGRHSILLLEAGGIDRGWHIHMPLAVGELLKSGLHNWNYVTEPEHHIGGRRIAHPRGKVLGGSSSINGMVYTRGHALDYENWANNFGCTGWGYAGVLPYFTRAETSSRGASAYRGYAGPLKVSVPDVNNNPLNAAFLAAGAEAGYPLTDDSNAYRFEGFGPNEFTIHNGERWSASKAYLMPHAKRRNLEVLTDTLVRRILIENAKAVGIEIERAGQVETVYANREVLVCAGAFESPKLLMLSGLGPVSQLKALNIPIVAELPGVGRNLQDHPDVAIQFTCKQPVSLRRLTQWPLKWIVGARWFLMRSGPATSNQFEVAAYIRSRAGIQYPNLKLELLPLAFTPDSFDARPGETFQIHMTLQRAESRGSVTLKSPDPRDSPRLQFNYLSDDGDAETLRAAVRLTREIVSQLAMKPFTGEEIDPGAATVNETDIDDWIRQRMNTAYHPSGTCRMGGGDDATAVLDPELRVRGVYGLRVVDASIMPVLVSSNINAPTIMIAERAADLVLGKEPLVAPQAEYWIHPNWQTMQR
jgi:choline dehydrogenase